MLVLIQHPEQDVSIPFYLELWKHPNELIRALGKEQLTAQGDKVVPYLAKYARLDSTDDYYLLCEALRTIGPRGHEHLETMAKFANEADAIYETNYKKAFMFALSSMGEKAKPYTELVRSCLKHKDLNVRLWACRVVVGMGKDGAPVAPELINLLENGVVSDKGLASLALASIGFSDDYDLLELLGKQLNALHATGEGTSAGRHRHAG